MKKQAILLLLLVCFCSEPVRATVILDQEQNIYDYANYRPSSGYKEGQSFTAGLTGTLVQIEMGFLNTIDGDGTVEIFSGDGIGTLLQTVGVEIYSEDNGEINYNSFDVDIPVESGYQYTFYFESNPLTMPNPFYFCTSNTNPYLGGVWQEVSFGDPGAYSMSDLVFRTWVEPIPEPGSVFLLGLGGLALISKHRL